MVKKFNDNQLAELYLGLSEHYDKLSEKKCAPSDIYKKLAKSVFQKLSDPKNKLNNLAISQELLNSSKQKDKDEIEHLKREQLKVWNVLRVVFETRSKQQKPSLQGSPIKEELFNNPIILINAASFGKSHSYCEHTDTDFLKWAAFCSIFNSHCYTGSHPMLLDCGGGFGGSSSCNLDSEFVFFIILAFVAAVAIIIAAFCLYYILRELANSIERFVFDEGWLQAAITLAGMIAGAAAGTAAGYFIAAPAIIMLALSAGVSNPAGWVILGIVCLAIIAGAVGTFVVNEIQEYLLMQANKDAIDPEDAKRFSLSKSEEYLVEKGLDPIAIKCAITEIHSQLGTDPLPAYVDRAFFNQNALRGIQQKMELVRLLREGKLESLAIGGNNTMDLRVPQLYLRPAFQQQKPPYDHPQNHAQFNAKNANHYMGAPPPPVNSNDSHYNSGENQQTQAFYPQVSAAQQAIYFDPVGGFPSNPYSASISLPVPSAPPLK